MYLHHIRSCLIIEKYTETVENEVIINMKTLIQLWKTEVSFRKLYNMRTFVRSQTLNSLQRPVYCTGVITFVRLNV